MAGRLLYAFAPAKPFKTLAWLVLFVVEVLELLLVCKETGGKLLHPSVLAHLQFSHQPLAKP